MSPKISIILPVYNAEQYVKEAIESILAQTFQDFELIVIDDGSSDKSREIVLQFNDPKIVFLKNDKNLGLVRTLNLGISVARGEYIARMDADDISAKARLEKEVNFLNKNSNVGVVGTGMIQVDEGGREISKFTPPITHKEILKTLCYSTGIAHATIVIRKSLILEAGVYDPSFPHVEDLKLWERLMFRTEFANLPDLLYTRRLHGGSVMSKHARLQENESKKIREAILGKIIEQNILTKEDVAEIRAKQKTKLAQKLARILPPVVRHKLHVYLRRIFPSSGR